MPRYIWLIYRCFLDWDIQANSPMVHQVHEAYKYIELYKTIGIDCGNKDLEKGAEDALKLIETYKA